MRTMKTAAQPVSANNGKFDPSTWAGQARQLARNEAQAQTLLWGVAMLAALAAAALILRHVAGWPWSRFGGEFVVVVAVNAVVLMLIYVTTYARTLRRDTQQVRNATWQMELARGEDLDGDQVIGPPPQPVGHVVRIGGKKPREFVLPDLEGARAARPLARFPVPPNDVVYVLTRAGKEGLGFREWEGHRLPSGAEIDRPLWGRIIDGMVDWEMVQATTDAAGRRRVRLASDVTVDEMVTAVRQSVTGAR